MTAVGPIVKVLGRADQETVRTGLPALDLSCNEDRDFLDRLRGLSILRVVLGHLGLFWLFPPYTGFLHALLPVLFFVSGAVSFGSYQRSKSTRDYLQRRSLTLLVPYYILATLLIVCSVASITSAPVSTMESFLRVLLLNPKRVDTPFPLGQVWFLHALTIITVVSPVVFRGMKQRVAVAAIPILIGLVLSTVVLFFRVDREMAFFGHNLYQPVANGAFFFFGAWVVAAPEFWSGRRLSIAMVLALGVAISLPFALDLRIDYRYHSFAPSLYYMSGSFFVIFALLACKRPLLTLLSRIPGVEWLLDFVSTHAYPIFLLHTLYIFGAEEWFGWVNVMDNPALAMAKVTFVITFTFLSAVPFSMVSKSLMRRLRRA